MNRLHSILSNRLLLLLPLLLLSRAALAFPETFEATYNFIGKGMLLGETLYRLEKVADRNPPQYRFTTHTEPTGLAALLVKKIIDEESLWKWQDGELRPLQYRFQQRGKREKLRSRDFNWEKQMVTVKENEQQTQLDQLVPGTVDEAMFLLALMRDLSQQKQNLRYPVAKQKGWSFYQFNRSTSDPVKVPAGHFEVEKITRQSDDERAFQLWVAPELNYLPVLIEYRERNGDRFQLKLKQTTLQ